MKNKTLITVFVFIIGIIVGCTATWFAFSGCSCCCSHSCETAVDTSMISRITAVQANQLANAWVVSDTAVAKRLRAFAISTAQLNAMKILSGDSTILGFRVYMGLNEKGSPVRMVVGFGSPEHTDEIYLTDAKDSGPCPEFCDEKSDVMQR